MSLFGVDDFDADGQLRPEAAARAAGQIARAEVARIVHPRRGSKKNAVLEKMKRRAKRKATGR